MINFLVTWKRNGMIFFQKEISAPSEKLAKRKSFDYIEVCYYIENFILAKIEDVYCQVEEI